MTSNSSLPLVRVSTPLVVLHASILSSIQFPRDWCDKPRDLGSCMCEEQHDVLITDISHAGEVIDSDNYTLLDSEDDLARLVDWWTEGVVLPSICAIGILGKFFTSIPHTVYPVSKSKSTVYPNYNLFKIAKKFDITKKRQFNSRNIWSHG